MKRILQLGIAMGLVAANIGMAETPVVNTRSHLSIPIEILGNESGVEQEELKKFLSDVESALPDQVTRWLKQQYFYKPIQIEFGYFRNTETPRRKAPKMGFWKKKITLDSSLLPGILAGSPHDLEIGKASLIRAIMKLYDKKFKISADRQFQTLVGWFESGLVFRKLSQGNHLASRSPDSSEYRSARDAFLVNVEFFLLDSEFKCRRPALYSFFEDYFRWSPFSQVNCEKSTVALIQPGFVSSGEVRMGNLDIRRLYQIHYLLATGGDYIGNGWGHSMLRFVFCKAERPTMGPECLTEDLSEHLVVSFQVTLLDLFFSRLHAIFGSYPSQLFIRKMDEVVDSYTKDEFRHLVSLPLSLSDSQKELILNRVLEQAWSYAGKYYVLSANCATEVLNLIRCAFPKGSLRAKAFEPTPYGIHTITPYGLRKNLVAHDIVEHTGLWDSKGEIIDQDRAEELGFFFRSKRKFFLEVFEKLSKDLGRSHPWIKSQRLFSDLDYYLRKSSWKERKNVYLSIMGSEEVDSTQKLKILSQFGILEKQVFRARFLRLLKLSGRKAVKSIKNWKEKIKIAREWYLEVSPWDAISGGYGVALPDDLNRQQMDAYFSAFNHRLLERQDWIASLGSDVSAALEEALESQRLIRVFGEAKVCFGKR